MTILVSVVVPTFRRPQLLERCLQALLSQDFPPQAYEVIVVDDAPEDSATRQLVTEWQQRLQARYAYVVPPLITETSVEIPVTGGSQAAQAEPTYQVFPGQAVYPHLTYLPAYASKGPAAARNLGWRAALGKIIAFTDDDCLPEKDWLANGVAAFVHGVAGVSGRVIVPLSDQPTDNERNATGLARSDFVTANCFYRRAVLEEVGGFDERFATAWREDSDLYFTLRERGYTLAWSTGAIVLHPVRRERWGSSLRQQRKSFYNALLYKKHPRLYWRHIQPSPPWHYYGIFAGLCAGLTGLVFSNKPLALAGLTLWIVLMARFIYTRLQGTTSSPAHVVEIICTSFLIPYLSIYWRLRGALHWKVFFL